jgi:hypothetical protein
MKKEIITRREFLKNSSSLAMGSFIYLNMSQEIFSQGRKKSRVVMVRHADLLDDNNRLKETIVRKMLDNAICALVDHKDPAEAWKMIVRGKDVVGIKSNAWHYLSTPPELENAIKKRVLQAGVAEENLSVRDRGVLSDSIFTNATALINVRPMRTHHWSGVGTLLKNYIMFVDSPSSYHHDSCADLGAIWKLPVVKDKTRLNILVLFTPLFHSVGPHNFNAEYTWKYNGLMVGFDPVAVDACGVRVIMAKRKEYFGEDRPLNPPPKHIFLADTRHHLGTADPANIELIKLGWEEGILI